MTASVQAELSGRPIYVARSPWGPFGAIAAVAVILAVSKVLIPWCFYIISPTGLGPPKVFGNAFPRNLQLVIQVVSIALIWLVSGMRGGERRAVLSLNYEKGQFSTYVVLASILWTVTFPAGFLLKEFIGPGFEAVSLSPVTARDAWLKPLVPLVSAVSLVIAAPLEEELLFRGFLLSALANSRIRFWKAALLVNACWVFLHPGYPWHALSTAFLLGILLSFALWKTGNLWTCIFAHGFYNLEPAMLQALFLR